MSLCPTTIDACGDAPTCGKMTVVDCQCEVAPIVLCADGDGCCAPGCDASNDSDCSASCGNGTIEEGEACEGELCPTTCDDGRACTTDVLTGSAENCNSVCSHIDVTRCDDGDGCCAPGCNSTNDNDCSASCGNGVIEGSELCDGASCPTSCADDGNTCTTEVLLGSAATCNAECISEPIGSCQSGDGCCAPGCNANNDSDCEAICGNDVKEPGETCEPKIGCPTSCNDGNKCTTDSLGGSATTCDATCTFSPITACRGGDGCCPGGCGYADDSDCALPAKPDCRDAANWPWKSIEDEVFRLVNERRASGATCGSTKMPAVPALKRNAQLDEASRCHSADMAEHNYFSHDSLDGRSPWQRMADAGYTGSPRGENIAGGQSTAAGAMQSWMNSEGHCKIIMSADSSEIGIGTVLDWAGEADRKWTQGFGTR